MRSLKKIRKKPNRTGEERNKAESQQDVQEMGDNEQELEALIYDETDFDEDDSFQDELLDQVEDLEDQEPAPDGLKMEVKKYSATFKRQISSLKNARIKKNKINDLDKYVRDADNGLSYTRMKKRVERAHPRKLVDGKRVKYPI